MFLRFWGTPLEVAVKIPAAIFFEKLLNNSFENFLNQFLEMSLRTFLCGNFFLICVFNFSLFFLTIHLENVLVITLCITSMLFWKITGIDWVVHSVILWKLFQRIFCDLFYEMPMNYLLQNLQIRWESSDCYKITRFLDYFIGNFFSNSFEI